MEGGLQLSSRTAVGDKSKGDKYNMKLSTLRLNMCKYRQLQVALNFDIDVVREFKLPGVVDIYVCEMIDMSHEHK